MSTIAELRQRDLALLNQLLGYNSIRHAAKMRGTTWAQARCDMWAGRIRIVPMLQYWQMRKFIFKTTRLGV